MAQERRKGRQTGVIEGTCGVDGGTEEAVPSIGAYPTTPLKAWPVWIPMRTCVRKAVSVPHSGVAAYASSVPHYGVAAYTSSVLHTRVGR
eukprot:2144082-Rhodomonas_salina.2